MPLTTADFSSLTDDLESIFSETANSAIAEMTAAQLLFNMFDEGRLTHEHLVLHGMSGIKKLVEGQNIPSTTSVEGDTITATQEGYGAKASITKKMRMFDLHDQIEARVKSLTQAAFDNLDQSLADVLSYGASTSYTDVYGESVTSVGPDGLALFSASHTTPLNSTTFSNLINDGTSNNTAFSREGVVNTQVLGKTYQDPNGLTRPVNYDIIVCAPTLTDTIERTINSPQMAGTSNNDDNPLRNKIKQIVEWERLENTGQSASRSNYWYMASSKNVKETLQVIFAERPSLDAPDVVYENKNWDYTLDFYYSILRGFPNYIRQSSGVN